MNTLDLYNLLRMKYGCKINWLLLLLTVVPTSFSQTQQLKFSLVNGTNGILLGKINFVIQDKYGFACLCDQYNRCIIPTDFDDSIGNINIIPQEIGRAVLNLLNNAF